MSKAYIEKHIDKILKGELIELVDEYVLVKIIYSEKITNKFKQIFIQDFSEQLIPFASKFPYSCFNVYGKDKMLNQLYQSIRDSNDGEVIQKLLLSQIEYLDSDEVLALLERMGEPFNELNENKKTEFPSDSETKAILDTLYEKGVIIKLEIISHEPKKYVTRLNKRAF